MQPGFRPKQIHGLLFTRLPGAWFLNLLQLYFYSCEDSNIYMCSFTQSEIYKISNLNILQFNKSRIYKILIVHNLKNPNWFEIRETRVHLFADIQAC